VNYLKSKASGGCWVDIFTSDHHFHHANVIKYCNRPFESVEQMDETLIDSWNTNVLPGDEIYHLGDIVFARRNLNTALSILERLNSKIFLIQGNHDRFVIKDEKCRRRFEWIKEIAIIHVKLNGRKKDIILNHYAMRTWDRAHYGAWHLFGHSHGMYDHKDIGLSFDIGVDSHNFRPISLPEVAQIMETKSDKAIIKKN